MTHVVLESCIKCKYTDCVEVCPVDCFYEGELMLVINPEECIDCGVCIAECPINAIVEEQEDNIEWVEFAKDKIGTWPVITKKKLALPEAEEFKTMSNKRKYLLK